MCDSTNVFSAARGPVGKHAERADCRTDQGRGRHGGGDDLRLERGAAEDAGRGGACGGSLGLPVGPGDEADGVGGAGNRAFWTDFPRTITPEEALEVPRKNLMLIVTGSQGERRAASAQLSRGKYLGIEMKEGDMFLFSSKTIPGNERGVLSVVNAFSEMGVDIVDDTGGKYHVSGHANRPDLEHVHRLFLPDMLLPMHGEHRHLREHVRIAHEAGIAAMVATNGMMIDITGDVPQVAEHIEAGRTYLDGNVLIGALDGVVRNRIRMALNGLGDGDGHSGRGRSAPGRGLG